MAQGFTFAGIADGTDLSSVPGWSRVDGAAGAVTIQNEAAQLGGNTTETAYVTDTGSANHYFEVDLAAPSTDSGSAFRSFFCVRLTDRNNFIGFRLYMGQWDLYERVGGTFTLLEAGGAGTAIRGRYRLEVDTEIRLYRDDILINTPVAPNASLPAATTVGVVNRGATGPEQAFDDVLIDGTTEPEQAIGAEGAWTWFQEPRAISDGTNTYFGVTFRGGEIRAYQVNNTTGAVSSFVLASGSGWDDDHANPTFVIRPDGRLIVFYAQHNGTALFYRVSTNVGDATAWGAEQSLALTQITYPTPVLLTGESNRVYVFYRDSNRDMAYVYSDDLYSVSAGAAATWSSPQAMILGSAQGCYFKPSTNGVDRIDFGLTDATGSGAGGKVDIRHVVFKAEALYASDGTTLLASKAGATFPMAFSSATAVATSGAPDNLGDLWIWDCARDDTTGVIQMVYARLVSTTDHRYYYSRYESGSWSTPAEIDAATRSERITPATNIEGYYSPGICLDHETDGVAYIAVGDNDTSALWRYTTTNGGSTWSSEQITDSADPVENIRPVVPRNRHADYGVLWLRGFYGYFDNSQDGGYVLSVRRAAAPAAAVNVTATPSGVSATGSIGSVQVNLSPTVTPTGVEATGQIGTVTVSTGANATASPAGVSATGAVGDVAVVVDGGAAVTGVSATGAVGTVTVTGAGDAVVPLTGVAAEGQVGTVAVAFDMVLAVAGVAAAGQVGAVTVKLFQWEQVAAANDVWTPVPKAGGSWS